MFCNSLYPHPRMFEGVGVVKNRSKKASKEFAPPAFRAPANHPTSIVAHYPSIEMLEPSQLSMDSELRVNSQQSSNFTMDVPLGQPSASMSSSSTCDDEKHHNKRRCPKHAKNHRSCDDTGGGERNDSQRSRLLLPTSQSSFSGGSVAGGSIQSALLLRTKKKAKANNKKTRFSGVGGGLRSVIAKHEKSQGSFGTPPSNSSPKSYDSRSCSRRSSDRRVLQRPLAIMHTTTTTTDGRNSLHRKSSPFHNPQRHLDGFEEEEEEEEVNPPFRHEFEGQLGHDYNDVERVRVLKRGEDPRSRTLLNRKKQRSPTAGSLRKPMLSSVATFRKLMDVSYPPIKLQPRKRHPSPIRQKEEQGFFRRGDAKDYNRNEEPKSFQSSNALSAGSAIATDASKTRDTTRFSGSKTSDKASSELTVQNIMIPSKNDGASPTLGENVQGECQNERSGSGNPNARNESLEEFKNSLQQLMIDIESKAKAKLENVSQAITSVTEANLERKARDIQEGFKARHGEESASIRIATQSNIDTMHQKQTEAEKAITALLNSSKTKLEETASTSVKKLEACTESSLGTLKKFTETWLSGSCKAIADRLKPYLRSSTKIDNSKVERGDVGCHSTTSTSTNGRESNNKNRSVATSTHGKNRLKRKSFPLPDHSPTKCRAEELPSSIESKVSLTQVSGGTIPRDSVDKIPVRPLRRSKRMKQRKNQKGDTHTDEITTIFTPTTEKSEHTSRQKSADKTPVRPLRRSKRMKQRKNQKGDTHTDEITNMPTPTIENSEDTSNQKNADKTPVRPLRTSKSGMKQGENRNISTKMDEITNMFTPMTENQQNRKPSTSSSRHEKKAPKDTKACLPLIIDKREKALCVTPTEGNSQSLVKKRAKLNLSLNTKSKIESNRPKPLRSKRRKRHKGRTPSIEKRSKIQYDGSQRSVPSEILAFDDVQLSPLDGPNLFIFPNTNEQPKLTVFGSQSTSKPFHTLGRKKRKISPRTYGDKKKRKIFDVMDSEAVFRF